MAKSKSAREASESFTEELSQALSGYMRSTDKRSLSGFSDFLAAPTPPTATE